PPELVEERSPEQPSAGKNAGAAGEGEEGGSDELDSDEPAPLSQKTTVLNVNDVELTSLIKTFSKLTKRNYIVDSSVKGKVTMHLPTPVTVEEALRIFDSILLLKGFSAVPVDKNTWKVITAKDAKQTTIPTLSKTPNTPSDELVTQLIRLKNTSAEDL